MTTIAGASQFLNSATLANTQGRAALSSTVLQEAVTTSLLEVGRRLAPNNGIGISASARQLNEAFLNRSTDINALFSLGAGTDSTIEGAQQQILALRAQFSDDQLAPSLRSDNGQVAESENGQNVDTTA